MQETMNINSPIANMTGKTKQGIAMNHQSTVAKCKVIPKFLKASNFQNMSPVSTPVFLNSVRIAQLKYLKSHVWKYFNAKYFSLSFYI